MNLIPPIILEVKECSEKPKTMLGSGLKSRFGRDTITQLSYFFWPMRRIGVESAVYFRLKLTSKREEGVY